MALMMLNNYKNYIDHLLKLSENIIDFNVLYKEKKFSEVYTCDRDYCNNILKIKPKNHNMLAFQGYIVKMNRLMTYRHRICNHIS
jgi:hypothetical protein